MLQNWERLQNDIRGQICLHDIYDWFINSNPQLKYVGGCDISTRTIAGREIAIASLVVLDFSSLDVLYEDHEEIQLNVPYVPGFLGFRECPAFLALLSRAAATAHAPQILLVDGGGIMHPRRCGSASHLGVLGGIPTIGVAKNFLALEPRDGGEREEEEERREEESSQGKEGGEGKGEEGQEKKGGNSDVYNSTVTLSPPKTTLGTQGRLSVERRLREKAEEGKASLREIPLFPALSESPNPYHSFPIYALEILDPEDEGKRGIFIQLSGEALNPLVSNTHEATKQAGDLSDSLTFLKDTCGLVGGWTDGLMRDRWGRRVLGLAACLGVSRKPLYISQGHRVSLAASLDLVRRCCRNRIPEPIRQADLRSRAILRDMEAKVDQRSCCKYGFEGKK